MIVNAHPQTDSRAKHMPTDQHKKLMKKDAALKGRVVSGWIAKLFLQMLLIINSKAAEWIAGLY